MGVVLIDDAVGEGADGGVVVGGGDEATVCVADVDIF